MNFTFLKGSEVAFYRSDAEQAEWTQEEMSLFCTFPVDPKKTIEHGMTVLFQDPATGDWQAYEIRNCATYTAEGYQQFTAEDICIAELTDCHIPDDIELDSVSASSALSRILSGTGWAVGTVGSNPTSSGDIGRGSVWQGVSTIRNNWNVNILSRVTVNSGGIAARYLDIVTTGGTWRGLRLAVDKNCNDPCVTYDDSELYTALYGYGATYTEGEIPDQQTVETTFADVVWTATADHPAKPAGQKFLEWPVKTAQYGRNGRKRFGYYQNTSIKDPNILLQKTWETLKVVSDPKISIVGTVADLKRMGYADEPLRLYDMAQVDVNGELFYKQIIQLTVNLLDPTGNRPNIGSYIPNIIYINRETEDYATGGSTGVTAGGGGRGGGGGGSRSQKKQGEFETSILQNERNIILEARQVNENREVIKAAGMKIDPITGVIIYAEDVENGIGANFKVQNNKIEGEVIERKSDVSILSSRITQTANQINLEVTNRVAADNELSGRITVTARKVSLVVTERDGREVVNTASIVAGINQDHGSYIKIQADTINLTGYVTASELAATNARITNLTTGVTQAGYLKAATLSGGSIIFGGHTLRRGYVTVNGTTFNVVMWD